MGSTLGPFLLLIYINDLSYMVQNLSYASPGSQCYFKAICIRVLYLFLHTSTLNRFRFGRARSFNRWFTGIWLFVSYKLTSILLNRCIATVVIIVLRMGFLVRRRQHVRALSANCILRPRNTDTTKNTPWVSRTFAFQNNDVDHWCCSKSVNIYYNLCQ